MPGRASASSTATASICPTCRSTSATSSPTTSRARSCLAALAGGAEPDLLLLDLKLPGIDGLDVLAAGQRPGPRGAHPVHHRVRHLRDGRQGDQARRLRLSAQAVLARRAALRPAQGVDAAHPQPRRPGQLAEERRQIRFNFISVLAHELKSPLNAVEGYLNILLDDVPADDRRMIERSLLRLDGHEEADLRPARPDAHRVGPEAARLQPTSTCGALATALDRPAARAATSAASRSSSTAPGPHRCSRRRRRDRDRSSTTWSPTPSSTTATAAASTSRCPRRRGRSRSPSPTPASA